MTEDIRSRIESFIRRGEYLQSQALSLQTPKTVGDVIVRDIVDEAAKVFVKDVLEIPWSRKTKKYTKAFLKQQEENQKREAERAIELEYNIWSQNIVGYLSSVSFIKSSIKPEGNSYEIINRIKRAQEGKRLETRIRGTISALRAIASKNLILNKDIPEYIEKIKLKKDESKEIIILPEKPFTGQRTLVKIIKNAEGYVWVMDSYVDEKTLDLLHNAPNMISIRLLTCFTGGADKMRRFLRACKNLKVEHPEFEIRKCDSNLFHDRFILTGNKGWAVGTSLKDTGKKLTMITEMSRETSKLMRAHFEEIWKKSVKCI